ncbi:MAG: hypothetical protein CMG46_01600 [Candidatus Marinimicrobia bacterium]|nr:hypothetical protein [Candidatus Neomarinimicrobiota bacterium]
MDEEKRCYSAFYTDVINELERDRYIELCRSKDICGLCRKKQEYISNLRKSNKKYNHNDWMVIEKDYIDSYPRIRWIPKK